MKSTSYDPYNRFAAALIASAITAARKIEQPCSHDTQVSALRAIAWLAWPGPAPGDQWFDVAGFEQVAILERLPLDRRVDRGHELLTTNPQLKKAMT